MFQKIRGRAWKFGDNVDTDVIIPTRVVTSTSDPYGWARYVMEPLDPDFHKKVEKGDILVAGKNFGCGSSREQAPTALKYAGIGAVIAESFARIFFRNSINIGLPVLECKNISTKIREGDILEVYLETGNIRNLTTGENIKAMPLPEFALQIILDGGLIPYLKKRTSKYARRS